MEIKQYLNKFKNCGAKISFITLSFAFLSGCQFLDQNQEARAGLDWGKYSEEDFSFRLVDEFNDGSTLHIGVELSCNKTLDLSRAVFVVTTTSAAAAQDIEQVFLVSELISKSGSEIRHTGNIYSPFKALSLQLDVPHKSATDYQLELLWGEEASKYLPKVSTVQMQEVKVRLEGLNIKEKRNCDSSPCQISFGVEGQLVNNTGLLVRNAVLGIGYVFLPKGQKVDLSTQIPQNEERVDLADLNLEPDSSKLLKLELSESVPEEKEGYYYPTVRLISAE